jgi:CSLREA domain-containing protein
VHRSSIRRGASALVVAALGCAGLTACEPVPVLELTVTTTEDLVDAVPGDGVCEATTGTGDCSLRAAVMEANATPPGTDVRVVLAAGAEHVLTRQVGCAEEFTDENDDAVEDLDVRRDLTVVGNGATIRTDGGELVDPTWGTLPCRVRVFDNHAGRLVLRGLTLDGEVYGSGAALRNRATAELVDVTAIGSGSVRGVVLHNQGTLTVIRSTVAFGEGIGSISVPIPQGPWAGIWSQAGSLVLLDSHVRSNNRVTRYGSTDFAGIHVASGDATIVQSIVTGHRGTVFTPAGWATIHGDGIDARGPVTLIRSTVVDNGAGRDVVGTATVEVTGSILGACGTVVTSLGYNADADGSCLGAGQPTDLAATPTTFGGPSDDPRWLPAAGSAVLDAVPAGTPDLCDGTWPADQRGAPRQSGPACDIGALERQPSDP